MVHVCANDGNVRKYIYGHTKNYRRISLPLPGFASFLTEFSISGGIFYFEYLCNLSSIKKENRISHRFWKLEHSVCIETVALPPVIPMCSALHRRSVL